MSIPTTGRTPAFLAKRYGYASLEAFIDSIPKHATVLDVGAGMSLLGHAVAARRPDVTWINLDPYYKDRVRLAKRLAGTPANVRYLAGNIVNPSPDVQTLTGTVDRIYSYWMLPHLSLKDVRVAEKAVSVMWRLLKPDGLLIVGPDYPYRASSLFRAKRALMHPKTAPCAQVVADVSQATQMPFGLRQIQYFTNRYGFYIGKYIMEILIRSQLKRGQRQVSHQLKRP